MWIKDLIALIPTINKILDLSSMAVKGLVNGFKYLSWKMGVSKLQKKKDKINEASTPGDYTDLVN
jgi:hypothetical protein